MKKNKNRSDKSGRERAERWITIPYSKQAEAIANKLEQIGVRVATSSGQKIKDMVKTKEEKKHSENSVVYEIPCTGCYRTYVGETGRGVKTRLREHKNDVRHHRTSNAIVVHIDECHHLPNWEETKILEKNIKKRNRKLLEAAHIASRDTFNTRSGFITWSSIAAKFALEGWQEK